VSRQARGSHCRSLRYFPTGILSENPPRLGEVGDNDASIRSSPFLGRREEDTLRNVTQDVSRTLRDSPNGESMHAASQTRRRYCSA